jgi:hypothetical protein
MTSTIRFLLASFLLSPLSSLSVLGQTGNTVFGLVYSVPERLVARGDVINLFVQGVGSKLTGRVAAASFPLPTVLAGISVALTQIYSPRSVPVPIVAVRPISTCLNRSTSDSCGSYLAITVQIPVELVVSTGESPPNVAILVVSENGVSGGAFELGAGFDEVHVRGYCDADTADFNLGYPCFSSGHVIMHADGTLVSSFNPAKSAEVLVMYAFGLGATTPPVPTGQATPSQAPITQTPFQLNFDYRQGVPPSGQLVLPPGCSTAEACPQLQPLFSGLTPGFAGLYQVNFIVPPPPPGTPRCDGEHVASNLTVTLIGRSSFDGAQICGDTRGSS